MARKQPAHTSELIVLIAALLLRLALFVLALLSPERVYATDSYSYLHPAQALLESGYYSYASSVATPTYPVFIAVVYSLFGEGPLWLIGVQVLTSLGTLYLTYHLGVKLGFSRAASIAGTALLAISLETLFSPFFILTDTLFTFLLTASTLTLVAFLQNNRWIWLVAASLLAGTAILCRPIALAFEAVIILLVLLHPGARFVRRILYAGVHLLMVVGLFIAPWIWRNQQVTGAATFTSKSGYYWLSWSAAPLLADIEQVTVDQAEQELMGRVEALLEERSLAPTEANLAAAKDEVAKQVLLAHPLRYVYVHLRYDLQNFLPGMGYAVKYLQWSQGDTQGVEVLRAQGWSGVLQSYFGGEPLFALVFAGFLFILLLTYTDAVIGIVDLARRRQWFPLLLLLLVAGYFLLVPGYAANSRYRIPAMPFLALLAGIGFNSVWAAWQARRRKGQGLRA